MSLSPTVILIDARPCTTSLAIAECFGKQHAHVMRDIKALFEACPEDFRQSNFGLTFRTVPGPNNAERKEPYYNVYFDGFMLLVMGYTGKKALEMKLAYIAAFNAMQQKLENLSKEQLPLSPDAPPTPDQQCTLRAIVDNKVYQVSNDISQRRGIYSKIWRALKAHFRVAEYKQIPQCRMNEAIAFLVQFDASLKTDAPKEPKKELPQEMPALPEPQKDKYEAYMEEVEAFRAKTFAEIDRLLTLGLDLVNVYKFGPGGIIGFTPILLDWLKNVAGQHMPLVSSWHSMERAIEYSPLSLMKRMEDWLPERRKK